MPDALSERYGPGSRGAASAAALLLQAEAHLLEEEDAPALNAAEEARSKLAAAGGDPKAAVDALRLVVHVMAYQGRHKEADQLVRGELARIRAAPGKPGEAEALLSLAEANAELLGAKAREESMAAGMEALAMFRSRGDRELEARATLMVARGQLRRQDDPKQGASEGHALAASARDAYRQLGHRRLEAFALHWLALARLRCAALGVSVEASAGGWLGMAQEAAQAFRDLRLPKLEAFERVCIAQWLTAESPRKGLRRAEEALEFCRTVRSAQESVALVAVVQAHLAIRDISKAWMRREAQEAAKAAKAGAARFRAAGDRAGEAQAFAVLALAHMAKEDAPEAVAAAEAALKTFVQLGDTSGESSVLQVLSGLYLKRGQPDKAQKAARQINAISSSLYERAVALETIHEAHLLKSDFAGAKRAAEELLSLCEDEGDQKRGAMARIMIASALFAEGDHFEAVAVAREAQAVLSDLGAAREEAHALRVVAEVQAAAGEHEAALRAAGKARRVAQGAAAPEVEAAVLFLMAQVRLMAAVGSGSGPEHGSPAYAEALAEASRAADEAALFAQRLGDDRLAAAALCAVAQARTAGLDAEPAKRAAEEAMAIFRDLGDERGQANVMCIQADIQLILGGGANRALQLAERALKIFAQLGDARGEHTAEALREHILGPPPPEAAAAEQGDQQWSEEEWRAWDAWQQQQQGQEEGQALAKQPQQPEKQAVAKKRQPVELGPKLDMNRVKSEDVQRRVEEIVKMTIDLEDDDVIYLDTPLMQLGVTSRTAVELRNALVEELPGVSLPFTMVFDYPSVSAMTEMIMEGAGNPVAG